LVEPRRACREDSIRVTYEVTGNPQVQIASAGTDPETLTYTLFVKRHGKTRFARQQVVRLRTDQEWPLVFTTEPLGNDSLVASDVLPESNWNSSVRLTQVSARSGRSMWVTHGGRLALVSGNGAPVEAFAGISPAGPWELRAALLPGEVMGDPLHAPPDRLRILTTLQCEAAP
jgi:hypothetical protein